MLRRLAILAAFFPAWAPAWQLESVPPAGIPVPLWAPAGSAVTPSSLAASVDGVESPVLSVQSPSDDLMLLVVLDLTDDLAAVEQARNALVERLSAFAPNQFVGVLHAQNGLSVLAEPSADRARTAAAIRSHPVGGRAGLLNTIQPAAELGTSIIRRAGLRLAILYLTDSNIQNYRENYTNDVVNSSDNGDLSRQNSDVLVRERIARMAQSLNGTLAPVFIGQLTYRTDRLNLAYQTGLISLAAATGGSATISRSVAEIPSGINQLLDRILAHYSVRVALPDPEVRQASIAFLAPGDMPLEYRSSFVFAR
jgi:hypothetical protein